MKKLSESMEIATWQAIAYRVQELNFREGTEQEFQENLMKLNKMLQEIEVESFIGERSPKSPDEIGTSSLLQSIQDINVPNNYKRATFYEKIRRLIDLGIGNITFYPIGNIRVPDLVKNTLKEEIILQKCYTDGTFQLLELIGNPYKYYLCHLCNANYALITTLEQSLTAEERYSITHRESKIILNTFNGSYPSKEEIMKFEFPELIVQKQSLAWGESPRVKEKFATYDCEKTSYQKRLRKDENNQYYYE